jgi:hypothetical protein
MNRQVYTNSPETSVFDVAGYRSWLDTWRYSQLSPGQNFLDAGWSLEAYQEDTNVVLWALSNHVNGALNLRIPGLVKYTRDVFGVQMNRFIEGSIDLDDLVRQVRQEWKLINDRLGKLRQLEVYRAALGLDSHSEVELCRLHRDLMDERDPSVCRKYDPHSTRVLLVSTLVSCLMLLLGLLVLCVVERKRRHLGGVWKIKLEDLNFGENPEILGRGTFGLVVLAEYRGTQVAVKRVIPPRSEATNTQLSFDENCNVDKFFHADEQDIEASSTTRHPDTGLLSSTRVSSGQIHVRNSKTRKLDRLIVSTNSNRDYGRLKADFLNEMQILARLRHPCITTIMGYV